ncbi:DUF3040 domain-containing protein [Streptomyces subrutilus]|uniref:DUF3040 domain-containing protein n=1 Tax=Streptomyces subrutilus TaxID=36818 RepID=A0A5P2UED0_9ACTN|nr:DUF3040 domain-containing protein [Streptomyces subrutilus]QEU77572.1 DUF3040 domain-containing protein [Streptomyces subrutilus]WSJ33335.1 DUF677 domain-containing protein [Streptomyces subrutilus]GGZ64302.1 hypothetical protein GCM10010371_24800 [Streptomyces subrutilus]
MDGAGLSDREQRALSAIEAHLKGDRSLDRRLRSVPGRHRLLAACLLGAVTVGLLVAASVTVAQPLIWAFAAAWLLTVLTALPLVGRWVRRHWQLRERAGRA